ncbi:MAG: ATP-binding protein [Deltaproteobacteria bacterium]|nr:ATP-binding protein [Deltaproteobacteria bacterium]
MYTRSLQPPNKAFFLFGPRGTGKSTWTKTIFSDAHRLDLLLTSESLRFQKSPSLIRAEVMAQPKSRWVVIDEIQKVPALLDEVHALIENEGYSRFVLTGSSARKLKRGSANLLAGRAVRRALFPLTSHETHYSIPIEQSLYFGQLPASISCKSDSERQEFLKAYVDTYLQEEIKAEALVKDIGSFARFIEIATLTAGQTTNVSGVSRDAGINRETVRGYFEILEDTLVANWLPAYRPRAKIKEVALPKFYWFDTGVLHAAHSGFAQPLPANIRGILLEHWLYQELMAYMHYEKVRGSIGYWATPSKTEIDFLWWYGEQLVAIEVKAADQFRDDFLKGIRALGQRKKVFKSYVVYLGKRELKMGDTWVLPIHEFLRKLYQGSVIG